MDFDYVGFLADGWGLAGLVIVALVIVVSVLYREKQVIIKRIMEENDRLGTVLSEERDKRIDQERNYACKYIELAERVIRAVELLAEMQRRRNGGNQ